MEHYDEDQATVMIAALRKVRPADRLNTLAVVVKVFVEGYLDGDKSEKEADAGELMTPRREIA